MEMGSDAVAFHCLVVWCVQGIKYASVLLQRLHKTHSCGVWSGTSIHLATKRRMSFNHDVRLVGLCERLPSRLVCRSERTHCKLVLLSTQC